ncbi:dephospho-CoA kinase [Bizionia gelidisalsuginis]|uniref:Dephospho-CoA kinase n=2 Tax=Bizionia TaxID=283785 RepID=A0A8H2LG89_9FLAO|nr:MULTISPECIES: dephospho-CoA kinase [Bizionia]TYB77365.1 dephospho-CoA kinase [Bizionia saleffrena]TYC17952.1 dephospho-CoA kinase [Bizionia gelidisalsuginis]
MKTVVLTGGIGSGKTTVAKMFAELGVPIYIADDEAKKLMVYSKVIKLKLIKLFGEKAYINNTLNRPFLAESIFNNKELLEQMNAIVHPEVKNHFENWKSRQEAPYVIKEAAIIFENGSYKNYDHIITVHAPETVKIERVLQRDSTTVDRIKAIMKNQWSDSEKIKRSNYVIENLDLDRTRKQVLQIHTNLLEIK